MKQTEFIKALAAHKAAGTVSLQLSWENAIARFPELPEERMRRVVGALPSPGSARRFADCLAREADPPAALADFLDSVDASDESLGEWMAAFAVLAGHLEGTAHRPALSQAAGYLECCEAVAHTGSRYETFPMSVETMLDLHGYAGET